MKYILKRTIHTAQAGVTLIEMLLVMGLMSIFLVLLTTMLSSTLDVQNQSQSTSMVMQDGRFILARLSYDVGRATAITAPAALGTSGSTLTMTIGGVATTYALNNGSLQLTDSAGSANLNGSETTISAVSFQRLGTTGGKETIRTSFVVTSKAQAKSGADTQTFTTTVGRRQ
jgi:prepilin-type N-terminal cleavage/methylation domain-containing protein